MRSFKSNENINKKEGGSYYVVSVVKTLWYKRYAHKEYVTFHKEYVTFKQIEQCPHNEWWRSHYYILLRLQAYFV